MNTDKICEEIEKAILKEGEFIFYRTNVKLSTQSPFLDRITYDADIEIDFNALNLRKILKEFIQDRDGTCGIDELEWTREWAKEFEMYAKKLKKHADKLEESKFKDPQMELE